VTISAGTQITELAVNDHACPTFGEAEELLDLTAAFVRDGLAVTGPLEGNSAARLTDAIAGLLAQPQGPRPRGLKLILDLSGLTGWDSSGLAALITAQQRVSASPPARMILAGLPGHLARHLCEAGLAGRFTIAGNLVRPA